MIGHSFQHFKLNLFNRPELGCQDDCKGDFEQIVTGDTQLHGRDILGLQSIHDHAFVIRVGIDLF